ncbi:hypothetical protein BC628DRAFT_1377138 [Trametes gibbosa]|uniref:C2H2-type domain-containing protein n=1 Tax=Trametes gibbosa TaxID=160864 RepID=A0A6G6FQG0_9APHY|nr:hypothetical protein BC628DRAFT_1377138 [Trametes gibbosa]QIE48552.1 hypothetical protein [Trametes gibbosa]
MSSWSSAYPPPPPRGRSRSRSPYRGGYPPRSSYPDAAYPQDPYRADWEAYDRDRAWANYERERAAYDYGRRGRSRSPPADEGGRKRRRSLSPWERDRYEPRPRYNDDHDAHSRGYGYDRGQYPPQPPFGSNRRAPPDPHTFDYPATLKQYAEWFRYYYPQQAMEEDTADKAAEQEAGDGSKPRNGIRSRWEKYKKEFAAQQLQRMFDHHRKSPWFSEKYEPSPELEAMRTRVRKIGWRGRMDAFVLDLESGKFDPDFTEPAPEPAPTTKENASGDAASTNGAPGDLNAVEETKPVIAGAGEDDMQFNVEVEEDAGDNDANRNGDKNKRFATNRGEEVAVPPEGNQIMIRTIPPDIGRVKLEESISKLPGFIYLALGDPLQKRNYYRAGWIKFTDDADMPTIMAELSEKKIEGFKLHVSHITKPFVTRVRHTPEVASKPDRIVKDLENAKKLAALMEEEYMRLRKAKVEQKPKENGDLTANGDNPEVPTEDTTMGDAAADAEDPEPREMGSEAVERRVEKVLADLHEQGAVDTSDEKALETKRTMIALDLYLAYLRAAFNTCYYCAVVTDHVEELQRKCVKHLRKPMSKMLLQEVQAEAQKAEKDPKIEEGVEITKEKDVSVKDKTNENRDWKRNDERWLEWLDSKIALLINRDGVDPRDYGGKSYEEELSRACEAYIKQEDEGKFRCKTCQKLFKATPFVEKHIANKHADVIKQLDELPYFNNFALDPHRIQPFAHPPQPVGSSQPPPPQAYGLQAPAYPADYARPPPLYHAYPGYPPYPGPGYWDPYAYQYGNYPPPPPRRDESASGRRLSDRISGIAPGFDQPIEAPSVPASAGLPAKPAVSMDPGSGPRRGRGGPGGPSPPPPPDVKEDPRAQAGKKVSYVDVDRVAEGDVELTY